MQPKLNSYVWIKFDGRGYISFTKVKVIAKGTHLFIHEGCLDTCKCDEFRECVYYEDYQKIWFKSLKEIRNKFKIKKICEDYYEVKYE